MVDQDADRSTPPEGATLDAAAKIRRIKPIRALPTERIAFQKQLDMLRAYAVAHEASGKAVTNAQVADIVKMAATTVPHANTFFVDVGFLLRGEGGYVPSAEVVSYNRAHHWDPDSAGHKLAPVLRTTWFANTLIPKLMFRGSIEEREAIGLLADASGATPDFKGSLEVLLDYLAVGGLVERDGGMVKKTVASLPSDALSPPPPTASDTTVTSVPGTGASLVPRSQAVALSAGSSATIEQHLLHILDPEGMSEAEQDAVWTLLKYLKKKGRA